MRVISSMATAIVMDKHNNNTGLANTEVYNFGLKSISFKQQHRWNFVIVTYRILCVNAMLGFRISVCLYKNA